MEPVIENGTSLLIDFKGIYDVDHDLNAKKIVSFFFKEIPGPVYDRIIFHMQRADDSLNYIKEMRESMSQSREMEQE